jgi:hypothetical protein
MASGLGMVGSLPHVGKYVMTCSADRTIKLWFEQFITTGITLKTLASKLMKRTEKPFWM